jgi:peptide/nickel transport system permease protein
MAYWRGSVFDNVMTTLASIIYGIPDFILALMMLLILGVQLKLFLLADVLGGADPKIEPGFTLEYIGNILQHAILPIVTYVLASIGGWMLTMKSSTVATLGEDYITVAQARGLSQRRILTAYVGRNAMLPLVTRLAISIGFVVSGSVIVEVIYRYPGLGQQLASAIISRDYTTMQGVFVVITSAVVISNLLADFMYAWLDPRVRLGKRG